MSSFFLQLFPFALPHDGHTVTQGEQPIFFMSSGFEDIAHALIVHFMMHGITVHVTLGTPMPETSVKFIDNLGVFIIPVHEEGFVTMMDHMLSSISSVSSVNVRFGVEVGHSFQGHEGMGFTLCMPTADRFGGQVMFWHMLGAVEEIGGGGDGDALFWGIEPTDVFEFLAEHLTGAFE